LEEENAKLKNEVEDLNLRLVHLEAREHNKELKLIHLQKELDETRSILIEKYSYSPLSSLYFFSPPPPSPSPAPCLYIYGVSE
jgi:hypothetical protein